MSILLHHEIHQSESSNKWVVFIHGAGGSIATWKQQLNAVSDFNVLLIDLRDHGSSKNITPNYHQYTFDIIVDDLMKVFAHYKIDKAHFITLSFGSVILQALSIRYPTLIDKMVIIGGIFRGNYLIRSFVHTARLFNLFLPYRSMYRLFSFMLMPRNRNQKARRLYQWQAQKLTQHEYMKWIGLYGEFFRLLANFNAQQIPNSILIIMGGDDFVFLQSAKHFASKQVNAQLKIIPKVGHICNIEQPEITNVWINGFLNDQPTQ